MNAFLHFISTLNGLKKRLLTIALYIATVACCLKLYERLLYEAAGPYTWDTGIYWAIGRGILNGLTPYVDMFETKPPGIFVISAISFWLTDDVHLTHFFQVAVIFGLFVLPLTFYFLVRHKIKLEDKTLLILIIICVSAVLALFTAERSGEVQVESFGAFFASLYALLLFSKEKVKKKFTWQILTAITILCSYGLKEPFIGTFVFSGGKVISYRPRSIDISA